jgi:adenylyltransferase/sulfurtransferase
MNDHRAQTTQGVASTEDDHPWVILPKEVAELLRQNPCGCLLIDCRSHDEWDLGHVQGAAHVPMLDLGQHMDMLRDHEDQLIVVMCRSGKRSNTVATVLRAEGFPKVRFMAGGIMRWTSEIDPDIKV